MSTIIAPNNSAILYSPFTWSVTSSASITINSGAYLRVIFNSSATAAFTFDTSTNSAPFSEVVARIDMGPWQQFTLSAGNPTFTVATGLEAHEHLLELRVKSTSETINRWGPSSATAVKITSIVLDAGASVSAPMAKSKNILIFGDSITEGVRTLGSDQSVDTNRNDNRCCYSSVMLDSLNAEYGIVAFGASGINVGGSGGVPALTSSYNLLFSGASRSFSSPAPDLVLYNEGTNDTGNPSANFTTIIGAIMALAPSARHLVIVPFNQVQASNYQAMVVAINNPLVSLAGTAGYFNNSNSTDGLHPIGAESAGQIAPKLLPSVQAALYPSTSSGTPGVTGAVAVAYA